MLGEQYVTTELGRVLQSTEAVLAHADHRLYESRITNQQLARQMRDMERRHRHELAEAHARTPLVHAPPVQTVFDSAPQRHAHASPAARHSALRARAKDARRKHESRSAQATRQAEQLLVKNRVLAALEHEVAVLTGHASPRTASSSGSASDTSSSTDDVGGEVDTAGLEKHLAEKDCKIFALEQRLERLRAQQGDRQPALPPRRDRTGSARRAPRSETQRGALDQADMWDFGKAAVQSRSVTSGSSSGTEGTSQRRRTGSPVVVDGDRDGFSPSRRPRLVSGMSELGRLLSDDVPGLSPGVDPVRKASTPSAHKPLLHESGAAAQSEGHISGHLRGLYGWLDSTDPDDCESVVHMSNKGRPGNNSVPHSFRTTRSASPVNSIPVRPYDSGQLPVAHSVDDLSRRSAFDVPTKQLQYDVATSSFYLSSKHPSGRGLTAKGSAVRRGTGGQPRGASSEAASPYDTAAERDALVSKCSELQAALHESQQNVARLHLEIEEWKAHAHGESGLGTGLWAERTHTARSSMQLQSMKELLDELATVREENRHLRRLVTAKAPEATRVEAGKPTYAELEVELRATAGRLEALQREHAELEERSSAQAAEVEGLQVELAARDVDLQAAVEDRAALLEEVEVFKEATLREVRATMSSLVSPVVDGEVCGDVVADVLPPDAGGGGGASTVASEDAPSCMPSSGV